MTEFIATEIVNRFKPIYDIAVKHLNTSNEYPDNIISGSSLMEYCVSLAHIIKNDSILCDSPRKQKEQSKIIIYLLKHICHEYPIFLNNKAAELNFKECGSDNFYVRHYRYLQSRWLRDNNIPVRKDPGESDNTVYGNYTSDNEANFMTPAIRKLVNHELSPEHKKDRLIEENRLRHNLLSSQPLCFNLFGELALNTDKATQFFNVLYNNYFSSIDEILFEYNPSRQNSLLTGDRSAFDIFVRYTSLEGNRGFIGIEVKYSENLLEGADTVDKILNKQFCNESRTRKDRYEELSAGIFNPKWFSTLETLPLFQIWRDHLLAVSMRKAFKEQYDEGLFLFLSPHTNKLCRKRVDRYVEILKESKSYEGRISGFYHDRLEDYIDTLHSVFNQDWTIGMAQRYLGRNPIPPVSRKLKFPK